MTSTTTTIPPIYSPDLCAEVIDCAHRIALEIIARDDALNVDARADYRANTRALYQSVRATMNRPIVPRDVERPTLDDESISEGIVRALNGRPAPELTDVESRAIDNMHPQPSPDDMRAIYSAASHYLRALYADQPSPHATKDNARRLAGIADALHARVSR